ncbi:hypothetical protein BSG1_15965 [Bacillus sp. SG-1]|nr:hypothetical protein BSG1_15965 [Bacillus sp. SG-1]
MISSIFPIVFFRRFLLVQFLDRDSVIPLKEKASS